jgi:hypothetical protein
MDKVLMGINCIKCGSPVFGSYCLNCGIIERENNLSVKSEDQNLSDLNMPSITSLFQPADTSMSANSKKQRAKKGQAVKIVTTVFLSILWFSILGGGFWFANQPPEVWTSPVILGAKTLEKDDFNKVDIKSNTKTIDFDANLSEGSLDSIKYSQFASVDENLFIELFGLSKFLNRYYDKALVAEAKKVLDFKDDDIDVYFENKFALIFTDDIEIWGLVAVVKNKKYIDDKISLLEKYNALKTKPKGAIYAYSEISTKLIKYDGDKYYLLVANSKEFLDRMIELSEGNLPNLEKSALYKASGDKAQGIALSRIFVSTKSKPAWTEFVEWYASHFNYAGLSKILLTSDFNNLILRKTLSGIQIEVLD